MLKRACNKLLLRFGVWRLSQMALASLCVLLLAGIALQLLLPIRVMASTASDLVAIPEGHTAVRDVNDRHIDKSALAGAFWPSLFKAATALSDKPMADKTLQRIRSQLTLRFIMEMDGVPVAYIQIKDMGLKKCKAGDTVADLFSVLHVGKDYVEIQILEHKLKLSR